VLFSSAFELFSAIVPDEILVPPVKVSLPARVRIRAPAWIRLPYNLHSRTGE
jgi:hypothetical protein